MPKPIHISAYQCRELHKIQRNKINQIYTPAHHRSSTSTSTGNSSQRRDGNENDKSEQNAHNRDGAKNEPTERRRRSSKKRITRPKRRKFIIWNRGILTSYLFLCVRHARLALTNLKLIGNSFHTLRGNFKIFGNLFGTSRGICALFFFYFSTKLSSCFSHRDRICRLCLSLSFFRSLVIPELNSFVAHLIYSPGIFGRSRALFGCFHSVIKRICQLNAGAESGAACVTLQTKHVVILALLSRLISQFCCSSAVCLSNSFRFAILFYGLCFLLFFFPVLPFSLSLCICSIFFPRLCRVATELFLLERLHLIAWIFRPQRSTNKRWFCHCIRYNG